MKKLIFAPTEPLEMSHHPEEVYAPPQPQVRVHIQPIQ
jgi:hypothetical protein